MIVAAPAMALIMICVSEVASQFCEPGCPYRMCAHCFRRFAGVQLEWLHMLNAIGGGAAKEALFIYLYLSSLVSNRNLA